MTRPTLPLSLILRTLGPFLLAAAAQAAVIVTVAPAARQLKGGGTCELVWRVEGTANQAMRFEVAAGGGTWDPALGSYTAPRVTQNRLVRLRGTSKAKEADPDSFADAEIWVLADRADVSLLSAP